MRYKRITFQTPNGGKIDVVEDAHNVLHDFYILYSDIPKILEWAEELGIEKVTKKDVKLFIKEGLVKKRKH